MHKVETEREVPAEAETVATARAMESVNHLGLWAAMNPTGNNHSNSRILQQSFSLEFRLWRVVFNYIKPPFIRLQIRLHKNPSS